MPAIHRRSNPRSRSLTLAPDLPDASGSLDWHDDALCREVGTEVFFDDRDGPSTVLQAKAICRACPVREACLEWALSYPRREDEYGVFGGLGPTERHRIRRERQAVAA